MFGKISTYLSYSVNALKVYHNQRFPANKLPLWGMTFTVGVTAFAFQQCAWYMKTKKVENCDKHSKCN